MQLSGCYLTLICSSLIGALNFDMSLLLARMMKDLQQAAAAAAVFRGI